MYQKIIIFFLGGLILALPLDADALDPGPFSGGRGGEEETAVGIPDAGIAGFVGPAGEGITANMDNSNYVNPVFVGWATGVADYQPSPTRLGARWQNTAQTLGPVTGDVGHIASLGDLSAADLAAYRTDPVNAPVKPGSITLSFDLPIFNGSGADFAVFENAFASDYDIPATGGVIGGMFAELAYVEVSTDGFTFARFPSIYLNTAENLNLQFNADGNPTNYAYGTQDPAYMFNIAGKQGNGYGISWGTPFDLTTLVDYSAILDYLSSVGINLSAEQLAALQLQLDANQQLVADGILNLDAINYVRLVDIPGNGSFYDSLGNPIYDAWQTYDSGGFDLDAVGVIHQAAAVPEPATWALIVAGLIIITALGRQRQRSTAPTVRQKLLCSKIQITNNQRNLSYENKYHN